MSDRSAQDVIRKAFNEIIFRSGLRFVSGDGFDVQADGVDRNGSAQLFYTTDYYFIT